MKAGWWDAPLLLRDLAEAIYMILTMRGSPFCFPWGLSCHQVPALATHAPGSAQPVSPSQTDFHTGTTKKYHPATTVHQQQPVPPSPHFHLFASTRQICSTWFTPESSLQPIKLLQELSSCSSSRWNLCNQYATLSQQTWRRKRDLPFNKDSFHRTITHGESPAEFSQALKWCFSAFHYWTSSFCFLPIFSSLEPSKTPAKDKQDFKMSWEISSQVILFVSKKISSFGDSFIPPYAKTPSSTIKVHAVSTDPDVPH